MLALIPGFLAGSILFYEIYQHKRDQLEEGPIQTSRALTRAIDSELRMAQAAAQALSSSEHLAAKNFAAFYQQAKQVTQTTGVGQHYVLSDVSGQQILNTLVPFSTPLPRHANPEQLRCVVTTGRPCISDLFVGAVAQQPLISINVPVLLDGKVVYDLSVELSPEHFNRFLLDQRLPEGWLATVFDSRTTTVARCHDAAAAVGKKAPPDLMLQMMNNPQGRLERVMPGGDQSFVAFSRST